VHIFTDKVADDDDGDGGGDDDDVQAIIRVQLNTGRLMLN